MEGSAIHAHATAVSTHHQPSCNISLQYRRHELEEHGSKSNSPRAFTILFGVYHSSVRFTPLSKLVFIIKMESVHWIELICHCHIVSGLLALRLVLVRPPNQELYSHKGRSLIGSTPLQTITL